MGNGERKALYLSAAYTFEMVLAKAHPQFFETRHVGGYFDRVWSVHPLTDQAGKVSMGIDLIRFSPRHLLIEAPSRSHRLPLLLAPLDFVVSQWKLVGVLRRLIRRWGIEVVITNDPFYVGLLGLVLKRLTGIPLVVGVWANYDLAYRTTGKLAMPRLLPSYRAQRALARLVLSRADRVIVGNRDNRGYAVANGTDPARCEILPVVTNMQDCHYVAPERRDSPAPFFAAIGVPVGKRYLLSVGRLIPVKFPEDGVRAMVLAAKADPQVVGLVAGDGELREGLEALVASEGLADRIFFLGNIPQKILSQIIPYSVTLSPITGMALIESGLGGSPVVAFDVDWQAEFIEDGVQGFILPLHDVAGMARRALEILTDAALAASLSRAIRSRALDFADRERAVAREQMVYERLLAPDAAPTRPPMFDPIADDRGRP